MNKELTSEGGRSPAEIFWENHYRQRDYKQPDRVHGRRANPVLADVVKSLPAGSVLDLGCGEGGDAIWLAQHGWRVTAVDVSATALSKASAYAAEVGVKDRIDFQRHDLAITFPTGTFDLVSAQYLPSSVDFPRHHVLQAAARAVAPAGLLLIVDHASVSPWSWNHDPDRVFPTPEETLAAIGLPRGQWSTERLESSQRLVTGPNGESATVTDNVIAMRRLKQ